jgi:hypothetical protein
MLRRRTGRGEGLWTRQEGIPSCLIQGTQGVLEEVEQAFSASSYSRGSPGPGGKEFLKRGIALGDPSRAKRNPYLVSPIISGLVGYRETNGNGCWPGGLTCPIWERKRERERERQKQTIAVCYLVNPIWPLLGGLPHSRDSTAEKIKPPGGLLTTV